MNQKQEFIEEERVSHEILGQKKNQFLQIIANVILTLSMEKSGYPATLQVFSQIKTFLG